MQKGAWVSNKMQGLFEVERPGGEVEKIEYKNGQAFAPIIN